MVRAFVCVGAMRWTALLSCIAVNAAAEWLGMSFTHVPNPMIIGEPQIITWWRNGSGSASLVLRQTLDPTTHFDYVITGMRSLDSAEAGTLVDDFLR